MRILLVAPYFFDSFAGKISMGSAVMAAHQLSRRHRVLVVTTGRPQKEQVVSENLTVLSASGLLLPDPINYVISPAALTLVVRQIRRFDPDLVLVNKFMFFTSFAAPIAKLMGKPCILVTDTYPGLNWFPRNRFVAGVMWLYARLVGLALLRSADKVVLLHEGLVAIAEKYGLDYQVIHNGPDLERAARAQAPPDLQRTDEAIRIAYLGRLESVKGYDYLLTALAPLNQRFENLETFFIGATRPSVMPDIARVKFLGFREDVYEVLSAVDIFCLPSLSEGLPNALMEAMSLGCACVASGVGGVLELVRDGDNGLLVPPGDSEALSAALQELIESESLRRRLGARARDTIESRFNWNAIASSYEELFQSILARPRGETKGALGTKAQGP